MVNDRVAARRAPRPSCAGASTGAGCATASRWSTRRAPTSTRRVELEPDVRLLPGTILEGRTSIGAGSVVGPDVPPRSTSSSANARASSNAVARECRDRRRLRGRALRVPASGHPARGRREGRHVRRGEELRDRRRHQGAAPLVRRRRRHRRRREPRREHDHRELRRRSTSTAPRSATACTRASTRRWSRRSRSATVPRPAPARSSPTMCRTRPPSCKGFRARPDARAESREDEHDATSAEIDGARHQEEADPRRGPRPPRTVDRGRASTCRSRSATSCSRRSRTARSTAGTARTSAAPTCSCSSRTATRSTTARWSS